ncbi:hypothetical protein KC343_g1382 [Hortaea werneckii]|uniref:Uncharacterized protein n=1 Tax=Hortaea werneckii TaxID=91943 RepID=A0A3M7GW24_HORWE|nr:hypothetical protein KC352_g13438 [Hortaea werneckii]KAI7565213.1 hypothetical protein KC317_g6520 [Hortaea werneckii]KAI7609576.1 hypothetical protein KC346_g9138 [Hortaea werneckii]KAI7636236.1 hypothetical protein KC343_g1382 [Hortaea werneckii]KAI7681613.1 hypothetical protein KC319_g1483 [Hortaea werneckii]
MGAEGGAPVSPSIQAVSLVKRLAQNVMEVKNALEEKEVLRRDLSDAQAACERLEKSVSSLSNARAMQKARLATLEQENGKLKNIKLDSEQKSERIKTLERDYHQLQELKTSLENDHHKAKVSALKRERSGLKNANAKLEDDNVALDKTLRETNTRLIKTTEAAEIAEAERVRVCRELEEERSKTIGWESKVKDLHQQLGIITELETELTGKTDRLATLEEQVLQLRRDLEMAAEKEDAHAAASRKASELAKDLNGLRTLLAAERATSQEALDEAKESRQLLECSETQCLELEEAAQAREICTLRERQYAMICWREQASSIYEENEYELAWSLQVCTQHEKDAKESRRRIAVEQEESAIIRLRLKDYQQWYRDICDELKQAKRECFEQMEKQRRYLSTIGSLEREQNKLRRELAGLEHDHEGLRDYSRKLEGDLRTLSSTTREALEEMTEQLRNAENEKANCERTTKQLIEQASNREIYVDRLRQTLARKQVRKRYIGTGELTQAESDLYFDARDCCKSSPALEVRVHGCLLPSGFSISTVATVSSDPRSLGSLEEGHRMEGEDVQVLRDVPLGLTQHGGFEEAIQQWKEHEAAMQQEGEHEKHSNPSKWGQEDPDTSAKSEESTRLSLQGWKAHIGLADEPAREVGSEPTGKPPASTQHLPATASTPSKRRCEAESIVSRPEIMLSDPISPISPREVTPSVTLADSGRPTGPVARYSVGSNNAQPHPRELFPHPRSRQASRDEFGQGQISRDPHSLQKRPREDDKNGSTDNRPPWNAPKRPRFSYPWK